MNNYITDGLNPKAPKGFGGICPICDGKTDKIIWCQGINSNKNFHQDKIVWCQRINFNKNFHQERCKKCGQLVDFKKNKVVKPKDIKIYKKRWLDFLEMQKKIPLVEIKYQEINQEIKLKLKDDIFTKIAKFFCVYFIDKKTKVLLEIDHYLFIKLLKMKSSFSKFKDYPENFPDNQLEVDKIKMEKKLKISKDRKMIRQAISVSIDELRKLANDLEQEDKENDFSINDTSKRWNIPIINKQSKCSDTWEIEK